eukprot:scaffold159618_cov31-Tisochrysis_lutea.AAC.1
MALKCADSPKRPVGGHKGGAIERSVTLAVGPAVQILPGLTRPIHTLDAIDVHGDRVELKLYHVISIDKIVAGLAGVEAEEGLKGREVRRNVIVTALFDFNRGEIRRAAGRGAAIVEVDDGVARRVQHIAEGIELDALRVAAGEGAVEDGGECEARGCRHPSCNREEDERAHEWLAVREPE